MFAEFHWTRASKRLALALSALFAVALGVSAWRLFQTWPSSYVWTELMISYQGGIVRRGLLGEILFQLHPMISAQALAPIALLVLYVVVAARMVVLCLGNLSVPSLLFLLSPVALLFAFNDFEAFGRKDIFIIAAFMLSLWVVRHLPLAVAFVVTLLIYAAVALTHELAMLYLPLAVAFMLNTRGRDLGRGVTLLILAITAAVIGAAVVLSVLYRGDDLLEARMVAAWRAIVPGAFTPLHAADYLSLGLLETLLTILRQVASVVTIGGFLIAAALGGAPVVAYYLDRPPRLSTDRLHLLFTRWAAGAMLLIFAIGADWGRFIHLFWMHAFIFLASIGTTREAATEPLPSPRTDLKAFVLFAAFVFVYVLAWRMGHGSVRNNPLWPGYIFDLQPSFRAGPLLPGR